jgi:hypothetical protein
MAEEQAPVRAVVKGSSGRGETPDSVVPGRGDSFRDEGSTAWFDGRGPRCLTAGTSASARDGSVHRLGRSPAA